MIRSNIHGVIEGDHSWWGNDLLLKGEGDYNRFITRTFNSFGMGGWGSQVWQSKTTILITRNGWWLLWEASDCMIYLSNRLSNLDWLLPTIIRLSLSVNGVLILLLLINVVVVELPLLVLLYVGIGVHVELVVLIGVARWRRTAVIDNVLVERPVKHYVLSALQLRLPAESVAEADVAHGGEWAHGLGRCRGWSCGLLRLTMSSLGPRGRRCCDALAH